MYVKPSEKNAQGGQESANQDAKETLPKTGQAGDKLGLLGFVLSILGLGFILQKRKESQN